MYKTIKPVEKVLLWGGVIFLLILAMAFLLDNHAQSLQAQDPKFPRVLLRGEYQVADGPWQTIDGQKHIPATAGDVTLRGQLYMINPETGEELGLLPAEASVAFYCNHISIQVSEDGEMTHLCDTENPHFGDDACGAFWSSYSYRGGQTVTLRIHNPHRFGNEKAVDQLLEELCVYAGTLFEDGVQSRGDAQRTLGGVFLITALILLGSALFLRLVHIRNNQALLFAGMIIFFAGVYYVFSSAGVSFWHESNIMNTALLGLSMMFYMLTIDALVVSVLDAFSGKLALALVVLTGIGVMTMIGIPLFSDVYFYDMWLFWALLQGFTGTALLSCLLFALREEKDRKKRMTLIGCAFPLGAFLADGFATALGWWQGGLLSRYVFAMIFAVLIFLVIRVIPANINAAAKAKELQTERKVLQAELQKSRMATMMSQIKPHFIYNTLTGIEQLCKEQPEAAAKLVSSFSEYLQGNFRNVDDLAPIPFTREIAHVRHYTDIETTRFPDMTIVYDLQTEDFMIPALTVQPLVENAIKHGLMGLEEGGTVTVSTRQTPTHFVVTVMDDGIGFDTSGLCEDPARVGIRNIRSRLKEICDATLTIHSVPGQGTTARIEIPRQ